VNETRCVLLGVLQDGQEESVVVRHGPPASPSPSTTRLQQRNLASSALLMARMNASLSNPGRRCSRSSNSPLSGAPWGTTQPLPPPPARTKKTSSAKGPSAVVSTDTSSKASHVLSPASCGRRRASQPVWHSILPPATLDREASGRGTPRQQK